MDDKEAVMSVIMQRKGRHRVGRLAHASADLTAKKTKSKTEGQLRKAIVEGVPGTAMSAFGETFDDQQMADLIAYIRSLKP